MHNLNSFHFGKVKNSEVIENLDVFENENDDIALNNTEVSVRKTSEEVPVFLKVCRSSYWDNDYLGKNDCNKGISDRSDAVNLWVDDACDFYENPYDDHHDENTFLTRKAMLEEKKKPYTGMKDGMTMMTRKTYVPCTFNKLNNITVIGRVDDSVSSELVSHFKNSIFYRDNISIMEYFNSLSNGGIIVSNSERDKYFCASLFGIRLLDENDQETYYSVFLRNDNLVIVRCEDW